MSEEEKPDVVPWGCSQCRFIYNVRADDPDLHLLKKVMPCFNVDCSGQLRQRKKTGTQGMFLRALALYQAVHGLGMPAERKCSPEAMKKLMTGRTVTRIEVDEAPMKNRSLITSITLDNGKTIHLAPSAKGVTIYKVTSNV